MRGRTLSISKFRFACCCLALSAGLSQVVTAAGAVSKQGHRQATASEESTHSSSTDEFDVSVVKVRGGVVNGYPKAASGGDKKAPPAHMHDAPKPADTADDTPDDISNAPIALVREPGSEPNSFVFAGSGMTPQADQLVNASAPLIVSKDTFVSAKDFKAWVEKNYFNLQAKNSDDVLNVRGKWDHAQDALRDFGIAHKDVSLRDIPNVLRKARVAIINCPGEVTPDLVAPLRDFVMRGGYLITTDWALGGCLTVAFPGYVSWDGSYSHKETVDGVVVDPDSSFVAGTVARAPWKLDEKSEIVKLQHNKDVEVLVRSHMLSNQDPNGKGILALTFPFGRGRVLHLVGHFDNDSDSANHIADSAPEIKISLRQAIAANFILQGLKK